MTSTSRGVTDPRVLEFMARLDKKPEEKSESSQSSKTQKKMPPQNFDDYLKAEKLSEWPERITSENFLDLHEERSFLGTKDDILQELRDATGVDMRLLNEVKDRMQIFEGRVNALADEILTPPEEINIEELLPAHLRKAFLTETDNLTALQVHPSSKPRQCDGDDASAEPRQHSVENCPFPGFRKGELTELPSQLEAPLLLNRVTKAQDFSPGFRKFWKKVFQSEASVAMMQDTFWWIFLEYFQEKTKASEKDKSLFFDRIADSFVALFTTVNPEVKDKVLAVYGDCLSQAVFVAYCEAFPDSDPHFQNEFKETVTSLINEWVSGLQPAPGSWSKWNLQCLGAAVMRTSTQQKSGSGKQTAVPVRKKLEVDDFHRTMNKLSEGDKLPQTVAILPATRETTKLTMTPGSTATQVALPVETGGAPMLSMSRQGHCGTPRKKNTESHIIGPGPEIERVMFNTSGRSPLVTHYLRMRKLIVGPGDMQTGQHVKRTQVSKPQPDGQTYKELINDTMSRSAVLSKEYQRVCQETNHEIARIERKKVEKGREIEELKKQILFCKNSMEIKIMSEKILDKKNRGSLLAPTFRNQSQESKQQGYRQRNTKPESDDTPEEEEDEESD